MIDLSTLIGRGDTFGVPFLDANPLVSVLLLVLVSFAAAMLWAPLFIGPLRHLNRTKISQAQRPTLYAMHVKKQGTPTMGGLLFLINTLAFVLLFLHPLQDYLIILLGGVLALGLIGLTDDYLVTWSDRFGGLTAWHKFGLQLIVAVVLAVQYAVRFEGQTLNIPFVGGIDLAFWMIPLIVFVLVSSINAVNLTDGLDGLAGGVSLFAFLGYLIIALAQEQFLIAGFIGVLIGSVLAFLWFNIYPARFFMGDVGALTLGGALGMVALFTNQLLLLPVFGLVFVLETISVIFQVAWRRFFHRKLFSIAPFHHHFEHRGWPETKVTQRFWLVGALSMVLGLALYFASIG